MDSILPANAAIQTEARDLDRLDELIDLCLKLARGTSLKLLAEGATRAGPPKVGSEADSRRLVFTEICDAVVETVNLRSALAGARLPANPRTAHEPGADPRRALIAAYLQDAAKTIRDKTARAAILQEAERRAARQLEADPGQSLPGAAIIMAICDGLHLPYDLAHMPDGLLGAPAENVSGVG